MVINRIHIKEHQQVTGSTDVRLLPVAGVNWMQETAQGDPVVSRPMVLHVRGLKRGVGFITQWRFNGQREVTNEILVYGRMVT